MRRLRRQCINQETSCDQKRIMPIRIIVLIRAHRFLRAHRNGTNFILIFLTVTWLITHWQLTTRASVPVLTQFGPDANEITRTDDNIAEWHRKTVAIPGKRYFR